MEGSNSRSRLAFSALWRLLFALLFLGGLFFLTAGTFDYWQAWVFLAVLFLPVLGLMVWLILRSPDALERRLRTKEKDKSQVWVVALSGVLLMAAMVLPGLDRRFGWSDTPVSLVFTSNLLVLIGYGLFALVVRENRFASRIIEVEAKQKVISSGPYAVVRHPMYLALLFIYIFSPLALGSYWAVLPALAIIPVLVMRMRKEEFVLARDLPGYSEYLRKVPWRMFPGVW